MKRPFIIISLVFVLTFYGFFFETVKISALAKSQTVHHENKKSVKADIAKDALPRKTNLDLELLGTIVAEGSTSYAIIRNKHTHDQILYSTGDRVNDAVVERIFREKVVLAVNGENEILHIQKGRQVLPDASGEPTREQGAQHKDGKDHIAVKKAHVEEIINNIDVLQKQICVQPVYSNKKMNGYKVTGITAGSIFEKIGLKNGDIVMGVNSKKITSIEDVAMIYEEFQSLEDLSDIDLEIKREQNTGPKHRFRRKKRSPIPSAYRFISGNG